MEGLYTVNLFDRQRDIYFGMPAVEYVQTNIDMEAFAKMKEGFASTSISAIAHLIYAGLMGGAELNGEKLDVAFKQVYGYVESIMFEGDKDGVTEAVGKAFSESTTVKYLSQATKEAVEEEDDSKKK